MKKLLLLLAGCLFAGSTVFAQDTSIGVGDEQNPYGEQTPWIFKIQRTQPQAETVFYYMTKTTVTNGTDPVYTISLDVPNLDDPKQSCYYFTAIYVDEDGKQTSFAYGSRYDLPLGGASEKIIVAAWGTKFVTYNNKPYIIGDSNWTGLGYVTSNTNGDSTAEVYFNATTNTYKSLYTINSGASTTEYLAGQAAASFANTNTPKSSCVNKATINYTYGQVSFEAVDAVSLYIESVKPFVAPINVKVPTGVQVYKYASYDNGVLTVEALEGDIIDANTPVILKVDTPADYTFNFDGSDFEYTLQTSPRTFLSDSQYDNSGFYGVHTPHYVPANGYVFNGSDFVPANSSDIVTALNCYFVADDAQESISIAFPEEEEEEPADGYYLVGTMYKEYSEVWLPNPSYKFQEGTDGVYTLTVGSMTTEDEFQVAKVVDGDLTYFGAQNGVMANGEPLTIESNNFLNNYNLSLASNLLNVTFTFNSASNPLTLTVNGTAEGGEALVVGFGNDQTMQSGELKSSDNPDLAGEIEMISTYDAATLYVYAPEKVETVYYYIAQEETGAMLRRIATLPEDAEYSEAEVGDEGYALISLPAGSGTLYLATSENGAPVAYAYKVVPNGQPLGVEAVEAVMENGAIYNVFGQKVDETYKGVVIKNGKKYLQR